MKGPIHLAQGFWVKDVVSLMWLTPYLMCYKKNYIHDHAPLRFTPHTITTKLNTIYLKKKVLPSLSLQKLSRKQPLRGSEGIWWGASMVLLVPFSMVLN